MYQVLAGQQVYAVVVPVALLAQGFCHRIVHVGGDHHVALAVP